MPNESLSDVICRILGSDDRTLGVSTGEAERIRDQIMLEDRGDDASLAAYDLLTDRYYYGRAW